MFSLLSGYLLGRWAAWSSIAFEDSPRSTSLGRWLRAFLLLLFRALSLSWFRQTKSSSGRTCSFLIWCRHSSHGSWRAPSLAAAELHCEAYFWWFWRSRSSLRLNVIQWKSEQRGGIPRRAFVERVWWTPYPISSSWWFDNLCSRQPSWSIYWRWTWTWQTRMTGRWWQSGSSARWWWWRTG